MNNMIQLDLFQELLDRTLCTIRSISVIPRFSIARIRLAVNFRLYLEYKRSQTILFPELECTYDPYGCVM
jgi:hypothetical protein